MSSILQQLQDLPFAQSTAMPKECLEATKLGQHFPSANLVVFVLVLVLMPAHLFHVAIRLYSCVHVRVCVRLCMHVCICRLITSCRRCFNNKQVPEGDRLHGSPTLAILRRYKFTIAFENSPAHDYVSERFYQPLLSGGI